MKTTAILTTLLGLALGSLHAQTVPPFINYQGRVTDSAGVGLGTDNPVNRKVIFRIFDAPAAGTRLWSEQHTVTISNGEFSVLLGNGINANYAGADEVPLKTNTPLDTVFTSAGILRFVEIVVDNGDDTLNTGDAPIAPRQQITSTAYSFRARSADTIASGTDLQLNGSANYGLGYYGGTRPFNGAAIDGPVLFGQAGGALGSVNGGAKNIALRWNSSGNVGIGSADLSGAAATTKLVLQGNDSNAAPMQLNIRGNSDTNKRLLLGYNTTSNYGSLQAYSGASTTTNLLLNPSGGSVGIGTTTVSPNFTLQSKSNSGGAAWDGGAAFGGNTNAVVMGQLNGVAQLGGHNGALGAWANLSINSGGGNVGIGTTNPQAKLDVVGDVKGSFILRQNGSYQNGSIYSDGNYGMLFRSAQVNPNIAVFSFANTTDVKLMTMLNNGNVGIGTTTPSQKLDVVGNAEINGNVMLPTTTAGGAAGLIQLGSSRIHSYGYYNLFGGTGAGNFTMTGAENVAFGGIALSSNTSGSNNTAVGGASLSKNTSGYLNTAVGYNAMINNITGRENIGIGFYAMANTTSGTDNIGIGSSAGPAAGGGGFSNTICVGSGAKATASNMVRLGNDSVTVFRCKVGLTVTSDRNLKENFEPVDGAEVLRKICGMNLTSWNYIGDDKTRFRHYGPMAQDFFAAFGQDAIGTVGTSTTINSGDQSGVMLSAIQELARKLEAKDAEVRELQKTVAQVSTLQKRLADLEAKDQARDAKMTAIEAMLRSPEKSGAVTVSLKQEAGAE